MSSNTLVAQYTNLPPRIQGLQLRGNTVNQPAKLDPQQVAPGNSFGNILNEIKSDKPNPFTSMSPGSGSKSGVSIR